MQNTLTTPVARSPELQQLSCTTCRHRKVRCNRRDPCLNCVKAGIPCVFPKPARNLRRIRESSRTDIGHRLKQLEDLVRDLQHPIYSDVDGIGPTAAGSGQATVVEKCPYLETDPRLMPQKHGTHEEFGRLVVDHGCGRYISNRLWASLSDQIDELHELLEPSYSAGEYLSPDSSRPNNHYNNDCFLFGFNSVAHTLANYHPSATQISVLWHKYQQNVAPLVMVLHQEAVKLAFQCYQVCPEVLDEVSECMLFAVYFSAAASMSEEECLVEFEDSKEAATSHFRFAIEQGFVKAGLTTAKNLNLLQAAVLYLKSLRGLGETRFAWTMTSLVVRLATGLGLHRDGSTFGLEPFEVEMRRRLWWCICILDVETAEDQGTDPMLHDVFYDTRLPLNINADDIDPFVKDLPQEQSGFTELTYFLLQCEVALATRRLTYHLPGSPCPALQSIEERQSLVEDLDRRLNERYVRHLDPNSALQSVCIKLVRISIAKLSLIIHQPLDKDQKIAHDVRDKIICHAIEMIELSHTLHMDVRLARWKWEFQTHVPWHALAFVLSEMCYSRGNSTLERAWPSISTIFKEWQRDAISQGRTIWQPLSKLMVRATYCRSRQEEKVLTRCVSRPDDSHSHNSPSYDHSAGMFPSLDLPSLDPIFQGSYPSATCMPFDPHPTNSREAEMLGACGISCDSNLLDMPDQQVLQRQLNDVPVSLLTARSVPWLNTGQHQHWDSPDSGLG